MTAITGQLLLWLAMAAALLQATPLFRPATSEKTVRTATLVQGCALSLAFVLLVFAFAESDFSLRIVAENSHTLKPLIYKITAAWGNHEGSMLLWALILAGFGAALALSNSPYPPRLRVVTLSIQGLLATGTLLFITLVSNPFDALPFLPSDGNDLNPLLQDIGLAIHPPLLYLGYVGFSIVFSFAIAGLITRQIDSSWAGCIQPWLLIAWSFLTFGIALGSWWAYRELGWGGYWFWDPVENVSLMPWLAGTALLHSNRVLEKRNTLHRWVVLLAIFAFLLSLIGTFLVRSGMLTSVHSFAEDPTRGLFILGYILIVTMGALGLYALRPPVSAHTSASVFSRIGAIAFNNLFLTASCLTILFATLYPLLTELLQDNRVSVGAPYFNTVFFPLTLPLLPLAALAPFLPWENGRAQVFRYLLPSLVISLVLTLWLWLEKSITALYALIGFSFAAFLIVGSLYYLWLRFKQPKIALTTWAMAVAHMGLGLLAAGVTASTLFAEEANVELRLKGSLPFAGYNITYTQDEGLTGANYLARASQLKITQDGNDVAILSPEYRYYPVRDSHTSETAIHSTFLYDLVAVSGSKVEEQLSVRLYYKPLLNAVWLGAALMGLGGLLAAAGSSNRKAPHGRT